MSPYVPLVVEYNIGDIGHIRYYLATKNEDDGIHQTSKATNFPSVYLRMKITSLYVRAPSLRSGTWLSARTSPLCSSFQINLI